MSHQCHLDRSEAPCIGHARRAPCLDQKWDDVWSALHKRAVRSFHQMKTSKISPLNMTAQEGRTRVPSAEVQMALRDVCCSVNGEHACSVKHKCTRTHVGRAGRTCSQAW